MVWCDAVLVVYGRSPATVRSAHPVSTSRPVTAADVRLAMCDDTNSTTSRPAHRSADAFDTGGQSAAM